MTSKAFGGRSSDVSIDDRSSADEQLLVVNTGWHDAKYKAFLTFVRLPVSRLPHTFYASPSEKSVLQSVFCTLHLFVLFVKGTFV